MENLQTWNLGDVSLCGIDKGEGDLLVLLHGFPAYHKTWERYIEPLSRDFRVVVPNLRGYLQSSKPAGVAAYKMERLVEDISRLVGHLGHQRVRIVGHDWGGAVAWAFASWKPEQIGKVAVFNCPHPLALIRHLRKNPRQVRRSWYIFFFQLPWIPEALIRANSKQFVKLAFGARNGTFTPEDLEEYRQALLTPGVLTPALNYYRASFRSALSPPRYDPIHCPSLLIWGERDRALGKELTEDMNRYFESSYECVYLPRAGHWSPNDSFDESLALLRDFL